MTPKTPDYGHREADRELAALERRLSYSYRLARLELQGKIERYLDRFATEDALKRALYDSGELSHEDYMAWRARRIAGTKQWKNMLNQLSDDMVHQNQIAASMINDTLPEVYAINHNYGTYEAEVGSGMDTTYTLYDRHTVARLLKGNPDLLPAPSVNIPKDKRWNQQQIQSALTQGILQGESMGKIAKRFNELTPSKTVDDIRDAYKMTADQIAREIARKNAVAAMRNARTSVTGAENAGRIDSYKRAVGMGIKMKQVWMATLDGRTRDSHAAIDGEKIDVGKKFSNGCRYPADPQGRPEEVYNCRCTMIAEVEGSDKYDPADLSVRPSDYLKGKNMTYADWKKEHEKRDKNDIFDRSKVQHSWFGENLIRMFDNKNVEYNPVKLLKRPLTEDEIIDRLAGGDMTVGSCMSLAYAYAANVNGMDVLDFRGGESCNVMARAYVKMVNLRSTVTATKRESGDTIRPAKKLLKLVEPDKEYVFITGRHAAIVRKVGDKLQYMELQSATKKGWQDFEYEYTHEAWGHTYTLKRTMSDTLKYRFGCGANGGTDSTLTDISCFKDDDELRDILGYVNTAPDKQQKGASGSER